MSTIDRICKLLKEQGKKQKDLTDYIGISKNYFTDWKSGRIKSYNKFLPQIADYFGVSVDYLLGKEETPPVSPIEVNEKELFRHIESTLNHIADYFGVSVDYLLGKESSDSVTPVDKNKKELFGHIDQMTDEQLEQLKSYAKFLIENKNK